MAGTTTSPLYGSQAPQLLVASGLGNLTNYMVTLRLFLGKTKAVPR